MEQLRIGVYPSYTRVVLQTSGPLEWSLRKGEKECFRIVVPDGRLDPRVRARELHRGVVRAVQPIQRPGGVEVRVACVLPRPEAKTFSLTDPDRIVVDISDAPLGGNGKAGPSAAGKASQSQVATSSAAARGSDRPGAPASAGDGSGATGKPERETPVPSPLASNSGTRPTGANPTDGQERKDPDRLTVVLDPGHGGHDTGAVGPAGLMEKDVVLDLALRLRRLLQDRLGMRVILTRSQDVFIPLPERVAIANRARADFFISLHVNGSIQRGAMGFETYYFTREPSDNDARASAQRENLVLGQDGTAGKDRDLLRITLADMAVSRDIKESGELAELALASLDKILRVENRGVKSGPFYVLATAAMPAVLVESAFITNPKEERKLQRETYRQRIAEALFEAIGKYKVRYERRVGLRGGSASTGS